MKDMALEYKIHPTSDGGVVVIGDANNCSFPSTVIYYKNVKEAIKGFTQNVTYTISEYCRTSNSEEFEKWLSDFRNKLEWICKD